MTKAAETRYLILQKAFELIYTKGYQATSIDDIVATTAVTKGAFFYHFKNKDDMGLAVIKEIMIPFAGESFVQALKNTSDPAKAIYSLMKILLLENPLLTLKYGCPAGNMIQEMSPRSPAFQKALTELSSQWQKVIEESIRSGKKAGTVRASVNGKQVAYFIMSGYWGIREFGKLQSTKACYNMYLSELKRYLKTLS